MAIQVAQPNFGGLGLAQGNTNLNLQPVGALGLQAAQIAGAQANARVQADLERQRMGQQFVLQSQQQNILRDQMAQQAAAQAAQQRMDQQKMGMAGQQFGAELDYKNRALQQQGMMAQSENELKQAALAQEYQQKQMARLMDMDKQALKDRGAMASYGLLALKNAKTPEEAAMIRSEWLKEAKNKKMVTDEEAELLAKSPLSKVQNLLMYDVMRTGQASEMKQVMDAMAPPKSKSGVSLTIDPESGVIEYSSAPGTALTNKLQGEVSDREMGLQQLAKIRNEFDPSQFTYAGKLARGVSATAELSKGIPVLEQITEKAAQKLTGKSAEDRSKNLESATNYLNSVEQFFNTYRKDITGAAAAEKELERLRASFINSDLSPSQFKGALDQLLQKYTSEAEFKKNVLREGLDVSAGRNPKVIADMKAAGYSDQEINDYYAKKGKK